MASSRDTSVTLVPFEPAHAPAAAALVAARVAALRASVLVLPETRSDAAALTPIVRELAVRGSGAVALREGRMVGFQAASLIDGHGGRWAYTPDIGHATVDDPTGRLTSALYALVAEGWVRDACVEHVVTVLADDAATIEALARLGFGATVVDLVRDLAPVVGGGQLGDVSVRRAGPDDAPAILELDQGLRRHLAASPIFLRLGSARSLDLHRRLLGESTGATFIAEDAGSAIAFLRIGPSATDVATIVRDRATASVTGAFTVLDRRGSGIASCLLDAAISWARDAGYVRSSVDHESANSEAARFWGRHFTPVAISMTRRLPPRVVP